MWTCPLQYAIGYFMNYIFMNIEDNYPVIYRHGEYGIFNPTFIASVRWNVPIDGKLNRDGYNYSLTVL